MKARAISPWFRRGLFIAAFVSYVLSVVFELVRAKKPASEGAASATAELTKRIVEGASGSDASPSFPTTTHVRVFIVVGSVFLFAYLVWAVVLLARRRWSAVADDARALRDIFPFTPLGLVLLVGTAAATVAWGIGKSDLVVYALGIATLGVGGVCLVAVFTTALVLKLTLGQSTSAALAVECATPTQTGFSISTLWFVPLIVVRWRWTSPEAKTELLRMRGRKHERVTILRRGLYEEVVRRVEVLDPFYLTKLAFQVKETRKIRALPSTGAMKQMRIIRSLASGEDHPDPTGAAEGDRADIRNYVSGDPIRYILWRVFAKSRQLVVRTPERALATARKAYAYLVAAPGDEPAAGAARVAIESGVLGSDWVFGADGVDEHADTRTRALEVVAQSARATPQQGGAGLARFMQRYGTHGARVLVFVPAIPGPWLARVAAGAPRGTEFIVCTDGVVPRQRRNLARKLATLDRRAPPDNAADESMTGSDEPFTVAREDQVDEVVKTLSSARARVVLADRRAGRVYEGAGLSYGKAAAEPKAAPRAAASTAGARA